MRFSRLKLLGSAVSLLALSSWLGCKPPPAKDKAKPTPPAEVAKPAKEDQLNTITLTPAAEERLGVTLAAVEVRTIERQRLYGAEAILPTGAAVVVSAPVGGTLRAPSDKPVTVGAKVRRGQAIFQLWPLLSPERAVLTPAERVNMAAARNTLMQQQVDAERALNAAQVQRGAAQIALDRAERLLREQAGTARVVDEARAQMKLTERDLEAAQLRLKLVEKLSLEGEEPGKQAPIAIESPQDGIVRTMPAVAGEVIAPGALLFEVMTTDPLWLRVPVYVGELDELAADASAQISNLSAKDEQKTWAAPPIAAPPSAAALASTVDLYYELPNPEGCWRPGQRVAARLLLKSKAPERVIPWSAVIHDIYGGQWVYVQTAPRTFVRQRVQVRYVKGSDAVLDAGPNEGEQVVTAGAVEIFGTEFGFAK